ncbi:uncharacterized protein LOC110935753 isoform X3 [Helianthus annuus]|nr:uncharacterized protein LOC110935753 isoform X2 [Helianthus annuus]XP_022033798.1 uncharacterized protein LOC110935753 isoform X3 [Helianthus annuus]
MTRYCSPFCLKFSGSQNNFRETEISALFYNGSQADDDDARACHRRSVITEPQKTPPFKTLNHSLLSTTANPFANLINMKHKRNNSNRERVINLNSGVIIIKAYFFFADCGCSVPTLMVYKSICEADHPNYL